MAGWSSIYQWSNSIHNEPGERSQIEVTTPGLHVLNIWMREDGLLVDKIVLTTNPDFTLEGTEPGPRESKLMLMAFDPSPAYSATDVLRDVVLSWKPGDSVAPVNGHTVYFSENFDAVNDGLDGINQDANSFDPGHLAFDTVYYWRVDEVTPDNTVYKGDVWSFTVEPKALPIGSGSITATASSFGTDQGPVNTINGYGLDVNDLHSAGNADMWLSSLTGPQPTWIEYEFDRVYKLNQMWVWNHNSLSEQGFGLGIKDATIEYSVDGVNWTTLGTTHEFTRAPGAADYESNTTVELNGAAAKYVKITPISNWGGIVSQYGLSEVRFSYIPVQAREPNPDTGATALPIEVDLSWRAGHEAAVHEIYMGTDPNALNLVDQTSDTSYTVSGDLDQIHYWRIDEVNGAETTSTWQGDIWNFTTTDFLIVDDFEAYNDLNPDDPDSNRIFLKWIGGDDQLANGLQVGNNTFPFAEETIVNNGSQSMPLLYSNTGTATYSEAELPLESEDWTRAGIKTLVLYFHGVSDNTGQLSVKINGIEVPYPGDAADISRPRWKQWNIDLASISVDLGNVTSLSIRIDGNGAAGTFYVDDIRLYRFAPEVVVPSEEIWIEAEAADTITEPMLIFDDPAASGGKYIGTFNGIGNDYDPPTAAGVATYNFTAQGGDYNISLRASTPDGSNSFWIRIPGATNYAPGTHTNGWITFNDISAGDDWHWDEVHSSDHDLEVVTITVPAGQQMLEIAYREDGTLLDLIVISRID